MASLQQESSNVPPVPSVAWIVRRAQGTLRGIAHAATIGLKKIPRVYLANRRKHRWRDDPVSPQMPAGFAAGNYAATEASGYRTELAVTKKYQSLGQPRRRSSSSERIAPGSIISGAPSRTIRRLRARLQGVTAGKTRPPATVMGRTTCINLRTCPALTTLAHAAVR